MAYYNRNTSRNRSYGKKRSYGQKNKSKYTKAEKLAFDLGQKDRVLDTLRSGKTENRVYEAYCKGLHGMPNAGRKKPLFAD